MQSLHRKSWPHYLLCSCRNHCVYLLEKEWILQTLCFCPRKWKEAHTFYHMVNSRGLPYNRRNFVVGNTELKDLVKSLDKDKINTSIAKQRNKVAFKWTFWTAPWWCVWNNDQSCNFNDIFGNADITDKELQTEFTGVESLLNLWTLSHQSADVKDDIPLIPNHFLYGQIGGKLSLRWIDTELRTII